MKNYKIIIGVVMLALSSCGVNTNTTKAGYDRPDSLANQYVDQPLTGTLFTMMQIRDTVKAGEMLNLKFTVYNNTNTIQQFCKWHTPFEPLMSKYLEIKDANGEEVNYQGAMAKRIMPPPESSYIKVNPQDSISSNVDLAKGYALKKPSKYTVTYVGQNMSGLEVKNSVTFVYTD